MTKTILKTSLIALTTLSITASSLLARDIALVELEVYSAENYRVEYVKLPEADKEKMKQEYKEKVAIASLIRSQNAKDPLFQAALDFRALDLWSKKIASKTDISEPVLKELYSKQEIKVAPKYKLRNILVKDEKEADSLVKDMTNTDKDKLVSKFSTTAKAKSIDPATKDKDGDSGWVDSSTLPKEIIDQLKDRSNLSIIRLPAIKDVGTQVILLEDKEPEHLASFDEAKEYLKNVAIQIAVSKEAKKLLGDTKTDSLKLDESASQKGKKRK